MESGVSSDMYNQRRIIFLLTCFFMPILTYIFWIFSQKSDFYIISPDGSLYINIAGNFLYGKGLVNTLRPYDIVPPPLYPLLVATILYTFNSIAPLVIFQYFMHGFSCIMIFLIAEQLFDNNNTGFIAVLFFSLNPLLLLFGPQYVLTETVYTFAVLLIIYFLIRCCSSWKNGENLGQSIVLLTLSMCLAAFIRPHLLPLILPLWLVSLYFVIRKRINLRWLLIVVLLPVILISINTVYNYQYHRKWIQLENYSGLGLYLGNNPNTSEWGWDSSRVKDFVEPYYFTVVDDNSLDFTDQNTRLRQRAISYILSNPVEAIARTFRKTIYYFYLPQNRFDKITIYLFVMGGIVSWLSARDKRLPIGLILIVILFYSLTASLGISQEGGRYRVPIIPVYLIFSGFFLVWAYEFFIGRFVKSLGNKLVRFLNNNK